MSLVHEIDYGTPVSRTEETVALTIDGHTVTVPAGTSIMRAAVEAVAAARVVARPAMRARAWMSSCSR